MRHAISTVTNLPENAPTVRLQIYLDGLQSLTHADIKHSLANASLVGGKDKLATLRHLSHILVLGEARELHACTWFTGYVRSSSDSPKSAPHGNVPFELFVKGSQVVKSKLGSQALAAGILERARTLGRATPLAILFLDGDTN